MTFLLAMTLVAAGVWFAFTMWSTQRSDQAHDLYQVGELAGAYDAEVYHRDCRGCTSQFRATIVFPDGERTVELTDVDWDRDDVPTDQWVTAPPPYDRTFVVYYDPDASHDRIMTVEDVEAWVYDDGVTGYWVVFGVLVVLVLSLVRPSVRAHVEAEQKIRAVRRAFDDHHDGDALTDEAEQRIDHAVSEALDRIENRTRERIRRNRLEDLVLVGGLVLTGVGVLLCATDARAAVIAMHLQASGTTTTASEALISIDNRLDRNVSYEVYAEIDVDTDSGQQQLPVELLVPTRELDEPLEAGWYWNVAPYDFEFDVRYDPDHPAWVVAEADLSRLARPAAAFIPVLVLLAGVGACVGTVVRLVRLRGP